MEVIKNIINGNLTLLEYKNGIRFGTDALLLAWFVGRHRRCADLGSGSGVLSLLLLSAAKVKHAVGVEFQSEYASLSLENAVYNHFSDKFECKNIDVCHVRAHLPSEGFDCVVTNPPYLLENQGKKNQSQLKYLSFHETTANIDDFSKAASYLLKTGGAFYAVYRPEYLPKLLIAMNTNKIECKRLRFVHPSSSKPPSLVLVKGVKNGAVGVKIDPPLYIYKDADHTVESDEMKEIYNVF